jgi:hypothetical protein
MLGGGEQQRSKRRPAAAAAAAHGRCCCCRCCPLLLPMAAAACGCCRRRCLRCCCPWPLLLPWLTLRVDPRFGRSFARMHVVVAQRQGLWRWREHAQRLIKRTRGLRAQLWHLAQLSQSAERHLKGVGTVSDPQP